MRRTSFALDKVQVEHRSLAPPRPFSCLLPKPVSVNAMYGQAPGRKRFPTKKYADWKDAADVMLMAARPPKFKGPVFIAITVEDTGALDLDNTAKSCLDLLVRHGVIEDDGRPFVREIRLAWGNVPGCRVDVRAYSYSETRTAA